MVSSVSVGRGECRECREWDGRESVSERVWYLKCFKIRCFVSGYEGGCDGL